MAPDTKIDQPAVSPISCVPTTTTKREVSGKLASGQERTPPELLLLLVFAVSKRVAVAASTQKCAKTRVCCFRVQVNSAATARLVYVPTALAIARSLLLVSASARGLLPRPLQTGAARREKQKHKLKNAQFKFRKT